MAPLADFLERPLLRRFFLTTALLVGLWVFVQSVLSRLVDNWPSQLFFELVYLIPLVWFVFANSHWQALKQFFGKGRRPFSLLDLGAILCIGILVSSGIDNLFSLLVAEFSPAYLEDSINLEVFELTDPWYAKYGWCFHPL